MFLPPSSALPADLVAPVSNAFHYLRADLDKRVNARAGHRLKIDEITVDHQSCKAA